MSTVPRKRSLIVVRHSPYGSSLARSATDLALAMGAFEQDFDLLFMGAGVLQLLSDQDSSRIGLRSAGKVDHIRINTSQNHTTSDMNHLINCSLWQLPT